MTEDPIIGSPTMARLAIILFAASIPGREFGQPAIKAKIAPQGNLCVAIGARRKSAYGESVRAV